jgi:hypothetical protein
MHGMVDEVAPRLHCARLGTAILRLTRLRLIHEIDSTDPTTTALSLLLLREDYPISCQERGPFMIYGVVYREIQQG